MQNTLNNLEPSDMQMEDDPQLLRLMLEDLESAPQIYQPTNQWTHNAKESIPELFSLGLHDIKRRKDSCLQWFGGMDLPPTLPLADMSKSRFVNNRFTKKVPFHGRFIEFIAKCSRSRLAKACFPIRGMNIEYVKQWAYATAFTKGVKAGAKSIDHLEVSLVGNPEDVFRVGDQLYTMWTFFYYMYYAYCCNYLDFDSIQTIVELGPGLGRQVEVIKKLHPDICFLLFDIPPQLYVCEQYLSAVFPDSVVSYRDTRDMDRLPDTRKGKIFLFGNWKFPVLGEEEIDLFWNALSFQEMEPDVVANYLSYVNHQTENVFLHQHMEGYPALAKRAGDYGVFNRTTLQDYQSDLANFQLVNMGPDYDALGRPRGTTSVSFWKRDPPFGAQG